ncbi:MAG: DUF4416 family protein [Candidatus Omnitrophota bacterium]
MGIEKPFQKVKLFSGFIYRDEPVYHHIKTKLESIYSIAELESEPFHFEFTDYYHQEMGAPLYRRFVAFQSLIDPEELPDIKLLTNEIERETAQNGKRTINLDPGFLSEANVIIATTKNYYHRVPLTRGIYAHMEYVIIGKSLKTLDWTYPDFKSPGYMDFFYRLNTVYKKNLKEMRQHADEIRTPGA